MSSKNSKKDEKLEALKKECLQLENALKNEKDPSPHINNIQENMHLVLSNKYGEQSHVDYFLSTFLPKMVFTLVKRSDFQYQVAARIVRFFQFVIEFSTQFIAKDSVQLAEVIFRVLNPNGLFFKAHDRDDLIDEDDEMYKTEEGSKEEEEEDIIDKVKFSSRMDFSAVILSNIRFFGKCGGFKAILDRMKNTSPKIPPTMLRFCLKIVAKICEIMQHKFLQPYAEELQSRTFDIILNLTDDELKNEDKKVLADISKALTKILTVTFGATSYEVMEGFNLKAALKLFKSSTLEKRLSGLNDIKEYVILVSQKHDFFLRRQQGDRMYEQMPPPKEIYSTSNTLTVKFMIDWIKENQIIEQLFGTYLHIEVIKRCGDILRFLATHGQLDKAYIDLIWEAVGKHESIRHAIFHTVAELSQSLQLQEIDYIWEKIQKIPFSEYDFQTTSLIRMFSISAINLNASAKKKKWYGLDLWWEMLQDETQVSQDLKAMTLITVGEFFHWSPCHAQRPHFMDLCVKNIQSFKSSASSLRTLQRIINTYPEKGKKGTDSIPSVIEWLDESYGLLNLFFSELLHYKAVTKEEVSKMMQDVEDFEKVKQNHLAQIKDRFEFLEYVLLRSDLTLSNDQIDIFWSCCITNAVLQEERDLAFQWLENVRGNGYVNPFSDETTQYIFTEKAPKTDFSIFTKSGFSFYEFYFRWVNWKHKKFEQQENHEYVVLALDLIGLDNLWKIALEAKDPIVGKQAITFLNNLHKNLSPELKPFIVKQRQDYIFTCMTHLAHASADSAHLSPDSELKITRCLTLLKTFLDEFEVKSGVNTQKHGTAGERSTPIKFFVQVVQGGKFELEMQSTDTIGLLRQKVSEQGDCPLESTRIITGGKELLDDAITLKAAGLRSNITIHAVRRLPTMGAPKEGRPKGPLPKPPAEDSSIYPSAILSKQEYFDQLFQLLNVERVAQKVWDLLMFLPTNQKIFTDIFNLQSSKWDELLDTRSTFKLIYSLQIVESLLLVTADDPEEKKLQKEAWRAKFLSLNGFNHLVNILVTNNFQDRNKGSKRKACHALLLKIISSLVIPEPNQFKIELLSSATSIPSLVLKLLEFTWYAAVPTSEQAPPLPPFSKLTQVFIPDEEEQRVVFHSIKLLVGCCLCNKELLQLIFQNPSFDDWLSAVVLYSLSKAIRAESAIGIYTLCKNVTNPELGQFLPHSFFLKRMRLFLPSIHPDLTTSEDYFELLDKLIRDACDGASGGKPSDFADLLNQLIVMVKQHPVIEARNSAKEDVVLIGTILLITGLVSKDKTFKLQAGSKNHGGLISEVFGKCLFEIPTASNHGPLAPPKCKTKRSRKFAFDLLTQLATDCPENLQEVIELLMQQHANADRSGSWFYIPGAFEKSTAGHVGLKNLGATCYMNSLIQQFYMLPRLRNNLLQAPIKDVEEVTDPKQKEDKLKENVLYQFQMILAHLQESEKKYYDTRDFCKSVKNYDGQPVNPLVQQDADEFFNMLFDKLEELLKSTKQEKILKDCFGGTSLNQIISKECEHISEREEGFFTLSLEVKNKKNILESLDLYVQGDTLEGDNKYFCSTCSKKVNALKRLCIKDLPDNLIIHQKRFEFDLELMRRTKVNDYCEFPMTLNMEQYTREGLLRKEKPDAKTQLPHPPSYYEYELAGILVHMGTSDSGHYYSYIRERTPSAPGQPKRWFHFNDTDVELFDPKEIKDACFGGYDNLPTWDPMLNKSVTKFSAKSYSAYMLFYERVQPESKEQLQIEESKAVPQNIFTKIWDENMNFLFDKNIFDKDNFSFVWSIISLEKNAEPIMDYSISYDSIPQDRALRTIQLGTRFLINTLAHAKEKPGFREYCDSLKTMYSKHIPACKWLLETVIKDHTWLKQVLLLCTVNETREILARLFTSVVATLAPYERDQYLEEDNQMETDPTDGTKVMEVIFPPLIPKRTAPPKAITTKFMDVVISLIRIASSHWHNFAQLFLVMREFARLGPQEVKYFLRRNVVAQIIDFYMESDSPYSATWKGTPRSRMGDKLATPNLSYALDFISHIVRSCNTRAPRPPPTQIPGEAFELPDIDQEMVCNDAFHSKALKDNINSKASSEIAAHLCWESEQLSRSFIDLLCAGINASSQDQLKPYQDVLTTLFAINDSLQAFRVDYGMNGYAKVAQANFRFKNFTYHSLKYILELLPNHQVIVAWLFNNLDKWVEGWLMAQETEQIRDLGIGVIQFLIPGYPPLPNSDTIPKEAFQQLHATTISEDTIKRVHVIYRHLLSLLPLCRLYWKPDMEPSDIGGWKLVSYFRLLKWFTRTETEKRIFMEYFDDFVLMFIQCDSFHINYDENKGAMIDFLHYVCQGFPDLIKRVIVTEKFTKRLFDYYISVNPSEKSRVYNSYSMPYFYSVIFQCCIASPDFLEKWSQHTNFEWGFRYLGLEPENAGNTHIVLTSIFKLCAAQLPAFRRRMIGFLAQSDRISAVPIMMIKLWDALLVEPEDSVEFCVCGAHEQLSSFIESKSDTEMNPDTMIRVLESGLDLLYKGTNFLLSPDCNVNLKSGPYNVITAWESKTALLTVLFNIKQHFSDKESLVEKCIKVAYILASVDSSCLVNSLRSIAQSYTVQNPNQMDQDPKPKSESTYAFTRQLIDLGLKSSEKQAFANTAILLLYLAQDSVVAPTIIPYLKTSVQQVIDSPMLAQPNVSQTVALVALKLITTHANVQFLDIAECEQLCRMLLPPMMVSLPDEQKTTCLKLLNPLLVSRMSGLQNAMENGDPSKIQAFVVHTVQLLKACDVLVGSTPVALLFVEQNKEQLLQLKDIISKASQPLPRLEELKNFLSKFTS